MSYAYPPQGPQLLGTGCLSNTTFNIPSLHSNNLNPRGNTSFTIYITNAAPNTAGRIYGNTPRIPPLTFWPGCEVYLAEGFVEILQFTTDANGQATLQLFIPAIASPSPFALQAFVSNANDFAVSNGMIGMVQI